MLDNSKMNKDEQFLLKIVQPSLLGFMDGSISTLAPVFSFVFIIFGLHFTNQYCLRLNKLS